MLISHSKPNMIVEHLKEKVISISNLPVLILAMNAML